MASSSDQAEATTEANMTDQTSANNNNNDKNNQHELTASNTTIQKHQQMDIDPVHQQRPFNPPTARNVHSKARNSSSSSTTTTTINNQDYHRMTNSSSSLSQQQDASQVAISADYLAQLIKDNKQLAAFPPVFLHLPRLLDEEITRVRQSLFQLSDVVQLQAPLDLPEPEGDLIELHEKVYVPVDSHPEYNFVGRILGPRGMTAKQLEQETGCKIKIRGRGSMRDKKKEELYCGKANWEHLSDELHVLITVEDTQNRAHLKIRRALEEVKKLLIPIIEGEDELKKRQLIELAIINGTYRNGMGPSGGPMNSAQAVSMQHLNQQQQHHQPHLNPIHQLHHQHQQQHQHHQQQQQIQHHSSMTQQQHHSHAHHLQHHMAQQHHQQHLQQPNPMSFLTSQQAPVSSNMSTGSNTPTSSQQHHHLSQHHHHHHHHPLDTLSGSLHQQHALHNQVALAQQHNRHQMGTNASGGGDASGSHAIGQTQPTGTAQQQQLLGSHHSHAHAHAHHSHQQVAAAAAAAAALMAAQQHHTHAHSHNVASASQLQDHAHSHQDQVAAAAAAANALLYAQQYHQFQYATLSAQQHQLTVTSSPSSGYQAQTFNSSGLLADGSTSSPNSLQVASAGAAPRQLAEQQLVEANEPKQQAQLTSNQDATSQRQQDKHQKTSEAAELVDGTSVTEPTEPDSAQSSAKETRSAEPRLPIETR